MTADVRAEDRDARRVERLNMLIRRHRAAVVRAEQAEDRYAAVVRKHQKPGRDGVTADFMAAGDPDLQQAIGDCVYEDRRAMRYGIAALVELMAGGEPS